MSFISAQIVDQVADWLFHLEDEREIMSLIDQLATEQPLILAYLMAMGEGDFDQDEREILLFFGAGIWKMMSHSPSPLPKVSEETLDQVETTNMAMLEYLAIESEEGFFEFAQQLQSNYAQPAILGFVIESVMEDEAIQDENKGMMMIFLKVVIDCLQG
ncbi:MAG: hypothetical protein AAF587_28915 [Bacteroidota bacterium]